MVKKGERFEVLKAIQDEGIVLHEGPATGSFRYKLRKGDVVVCDHDQVEGTRSFFAMPEKAAEFELRCREEFNNEPNGERGYAIVLLEEDIGKSLRKIE